MISFNYQDQDGGLNSTFKVDYEIGDVYKEPFGKRLHIAGHVKLGHYRYMLF